MLPRDSYRQRGPGGCSAIRTGRSGLWHHMSATFCIGEFSVCLCGTPLCLIRFLGVQTHEPASSYQIASCLKTCSLFVSVIVILLVCRSSDRNLMGKTFMTFSDTTAVNRKVSMSRNTCANRLPLLMLQKKKEVVSSGC